MCDGRRELQLGDARPSGDLALTLYRAAQEGLTNALRHGQPQSLRLGLVRSGDELVLEVVDDGRWLSERVEALGGSLQLADAQPRGVRLVVRAPLPAGGVDA